MFWAAIKHRFDFPRPALVMGVVNVTPDSFYDGGRHEEVARAVEKGVELAAEGADILDVGGESTRPGATPVPEEEELRRVIPVIRGLGQSTRAAISVDTMKPGVARAAVAAGASIINDVAANRKDPAMWEVVRETGAGYVGMHMQGTPRTMQQQPVYTDVVEEVLGYFRSLLEELAAAGIDLNQAVLDPGIGFGKSVEHNFQLLAGLSRFSVLGRPLLVGASRKSFIGNLLGTPPEQRLPGSLACAGLAVAAGVQIIRAHDVAATVQAVRLTEAVLARRA